jgi:hypothetical protein
MAAIEKGCRDANALPNSGPDFIRQREVQADEVQADDGHLRLAIVQHQGSSEQVVMNAGASLDATQ